MYIKPNQPFVLLGLILHKNPNGSSYRALKKREKKNMWGKKRKKTTCTCFATVCENENRIHTEKKKKKKNPFGYKITRQIRWLVSEVILILYSPSAHNGPRSDSPGHPGPRVSSPSMRPSTMRCMMMHMPSVVVLNPCFRLRLRRPLYIRRPRSHRHFFHVQNHLVHFAARREVTRVHGFILRDPSQRTAGRS